MKLLGNIIWLIFGGLITAIEYLFAGLLMCVTIIGIPFGLKAFKLAGFVIWPFGKKAVNKSMDNSALDLLLNIVWLIFGGLVIALTHLIFGIILFITIIGIPFGKKHLQLAGFALMPFGKKIVNS